MKKMKLASMIKISALIFVVYVISGDRFLGEPYSSNSQEIRALIDEQIVKFFPTNKLDNFENTFSDFQDIEEITSGSKNPPQSRDNKSQE